MEALKKIRNFSERHSVQLEIMTWLKIGLKPRVLAYHTLLPRGRTLGFLAAKGRATDWGSLSDVLVDTLCPSVCPL